MAIVATIMATCWQRSKQSWWRAEWEPDIQPKPFSGGKHRCKFIHLSLTLNQNLKKVQEACGRLCWIVDDMWSVLGIVQAIPVQHLIKTTYDKDNSLKHIAISGQYKPPGPVFTSLRVDAAFVQQEPTSAPAATSADGEERSLATLKMHFSLAQDWRPALTVNRGWRCCSAGCKEEEITWRREDFSVSIKLV